MSLSGGDPAIRIRRRLAAALAGTLGLLVLAAPSADAAAPTILNTGTGCAGQTQWLVSCATAGESGNNANIMRISALLSHDLDKTIASIITDDDWDGTSDPDNVRGVSSERPTIAGTGYPRSRANLNYQLPTGNTGMSCSGFPTFGGTRRTTDRNARIQGRDTTGQTSGTSSSQIKFVAAGSCTGPEDFAYLYGWGANNFNMATNRITPGQSLTYTYNGDDSDTTGSSDFQGVFWRLRNIRTGATTGGTLSCPENGDNAQKSLTVTFPDRGAWVVEAELRDGDGCGDNQNGGFWFPIGVADVNSSAVPTGDLSGVSPVVTQGSIVRPNTGSDFTVRANNFSDPDSADGGGVQVVEWDLNSNTGDGVDGYDVSDVAGAGATHATVDRNVDSSGQAPGLYTVRARYTDNGAMDAADTIRRRSGADTIQYRVNAPPTATPQTITTESDANKPVTLALTDPDGDAPRGTNPFNVTAQPAAGQGTVAPGGAGAAGRTYQPSGTFAGTTSFQFTGTDEFQGTSAAGTVTVGVTPQTQIDSQPPANSSSSDATFTFSSPVTTPGVTFECRIDSTLESDFTACSSPRNYPGLTDGTHTFEVRARLGSLVDPTPATYTWTLDGTLPDTTIDSFPPNPSNDISPTFTFSSDETVGVTFECRVDSNQEADFALCTPPYTFAAAEGEHTFEVRAVDEFGRRDPIPASYTWRVDTTAPTVTLDETPANPSNSDTAHFEFSSTDLTASFQCNLDGAGFTPCTSPQDFSGLGEGSHTFQVKATDTANNTGPTVSYAWSIDLTPPDTSLDAGPSDPSTSTVATFEFSSPDGTATFECRLDSSAPADWQECSSPQLYADLSDGSHDFEVRARDAAGNVDTTPPSQTWTVDTTAPQTAIDAGPSGTVGSGDAEFEFSSDDPAASFECRIDGGTYEACASPQAYTGLGDGAHTFRVRATDALNNAEGTPAVRTWVVDTTAPTATIDSGPSDPTSSDEATFEFSADEDATFQCRLDGEAPDGTGFVPCSSPQSYSALADGSHTFEVRAADGANNFGGVDDSTWEVDTTAPDVSITAGMPATTSSSNAAFEFTSTDVDADFQCRIDGGGWQNCSSPKAYTGLDEGSHTFDVRSRDDVGNTSTPASDTWSVVDSDAPDTFIDTRPADPTAATTASYSFSSNEAGVTFECSLDGGGYSLCTSPYATPTLAPGAHTFRVRAKDADDNVDSSPAVDTWTISAPPAPIDNTPVAPQAKAPVIAAATGKLKAKGSINAATVTCGSTDCKITGSAKVRVPGLRGKSPRIQLTGQGSASAAVPVVIRIPKLVRTAIRSAGKGTLKVALSVTSASGNVTKNFKVKVKK